MKRILIIKPSSMGDIIHGLLVAEAIHTQVPGVSIDWVVRREFAPLVDAASAIDRCLIFERDGGLGGFCRLIREIRRTRYDAVLDMQGLARSGLLTFFSKAARKIGRSDAREGAGLFYKEKTSDLPKGAPTHAAVILSGFLKVLGLDQELAGSLRFDDGDNRSDLPMLSEGLKCIVIFPESRRAEKNWSGYEALTRDLFDKIQGVQILWCGHVPYEPKEAIVAENFYNLTGKTSICDLPSVLRSADCVVSNDSGPMHLAAALGRNLVAIFGPTDPARFGPYPSDGKRQRVLRRPDGDMTTLSMEEVSRSVWEVLE